jgi:gamma-glutamyl:cysteine ligase YbdK (ATP-grasp superfamily)
MGLAIDRDRFDPVDYERFGERLEECLLALGRLLERPGFGVGPTTVGAELELFLIDGRGRALPLNQTVRAEAADPRLVLEVDRFNLELNLTPAPLAGRPFSAFGGELAEALAVVWRAAARHGGRVVMTGILPTLRPEELRLHQGTVWTWNRAIYDPTAGGHLRVEMRALPAGPTVIDMLANAAFHLGLALALVPDAGAWARRLPFQQAHHNFYRAAQLGLGASLAWPLDPGWRVRTLPVAELARRLLPTARQGLEQAGVAGDEIDRLLGVIEARVTTAQTGAAWQRRTLAALEPRLGRDRALAAMLERYLELQAAGDPVHTWPVQAPG